MLRKQLGIVGVSATDCERPLKGELVVHGLKGSWRSEEEERRREEEARSGKDKSGGQVSRPSVHPLVCPLRASAMQL